MPSIDIYIPLDKIPDKKEREQLIALYKAERKWKEAVKTNKELNSGINSANFISSQPDVPSKDNRPTIGAYFEEKDDRVWVCPYDFGGPIGFQNGITIIRPERAYPSLIHIPMQYEFRWGFLWWAQVGFAGGQKICDEKSQDPLDKAVMPYAYLLWKSPVAKILKNLEYAIKVFENFPLSGQAWQLGWVWEELSNLRRIYRWFRKIDFVCPEAIACLDWDEIALNNWTFEEARKNDDPNSAMFYTRKKEGDIQKLKTGELPLNKFSKKYADIIRKNKKDTKGYIPIIKRDPFDGDEWE